MTRNVVTEPPISWKSVMRLKEGIGKVGAGHAGNSQADYNVRKDVPRAYDMQGRLHDLPLSVRRRLSNQAAVIGSAGVSNTLPGRCGDPPALSLLLCHGDGSLGPARVMLRAMHSLTYLGSYDAGD